MPKRLRPAVHRLPSVSARGRLPALEERDAFVLLRELPPGSSLHVHGAEGAIGAEPSPFSS